VRVGVTDGTLCAAAGNPLDWPEDMYFIRSASRFTENVNLSFAQYFTMPNASVDKIQAFSPSERGRATLWPPRLHMRRYSANVSRFSDGWTPDIVESTTSFESFDDFSRFLDAALAPNPPNFAQSMLVCTRLTRCACSRCGVLAYLPHVTSDARAQACFTEFNFVAYNVRQQSISLPSCVEWTYRITYDFQHHGEIRVFPTFSYRSCVSGWPSWSRSRVRLVVTVLTCLLHMVMLLLLLILLLLLLPLILILILHVVHIFLPHTAADITAFVERAGGHDDCLLRPRAHHAGRRARSAQGCEADTRVIGAQ
jgi:hypothetical protein